MIPLAALAISMPTPARAGVVVGDCDHNGTVAINDLIVGVLIALGDRPVSDCQSLDTSSNGQVEVAELVFAVSLALGVAPSAAVPTETPEMVATASSTPTLPPPTSTDTATPSVTPTPSDVIGGCLRPGPQGLIPCDEGAIIRVYRCDSGLKCADAASGRIEIGQGQVGENGRFTVSVNPFPPPSAILLLEADVESATTFRVISVGAAGAPRAGRIQRGVAAQILDIGAVDPSSEGATRAIAERIDDPSLPSVDPDCVLDRTRDESNGGAIYAGLTAAQAADEASGIAAQFVEPINITLSGRVAADRSSYYVLAARGQSGSCSGEQIRITAVAASISGTRVCSIVQGLEGGLVAAGAGVLPPGSSLLPYSLIQRSLVLQPDSDLVRFSAAGSGRLTFGTGSGSLNVCRTAADCVEAAGQVAPLFGLDDARADAPACIANGVSPGVQCDGVNTYNTFAFGLRSQGSPPVCDDPNSATLSTTLCAQPPADGFTLRSGEVVVLAFDDTLAGLALSVAAAGFTNADTGVPLVCGHDQVLRALAVNDTTVIPLP